MKTQKQNLKKWLYASVLTGLLVSGCSSSTQQQSCLSNASLEPNIVSYFAFSNGSFADFNGNAFNSNGVVLGSADRNNNSSCALEFDGNSYLELDATPYVSGNGILSNNGAYITNDFSVSLWYKEDSSGFLDGKLKTLISLGDKLNCPDKNGLFSIAIHDCGKVYFSNEASVHASVCPPVASLGLWQNVIATYSSSLNRLSLYVNGSLIGAATTAAICSNPVSATDITTIFVGKNYNGKIDDIILFDKELSSAEALSIALDSPCCN